MTGVQTCALPISIFNISCSQSQGKAGRIGEWRDVATEELMLNRYSTFFQSCLRVIADFQSWEAD